MCDSQKFRLQALKTQYLPNVTRQKQKNSKVHLKNIKNKHRKRTKKPMYRKKAK